VVGLAVIGVACGGGPAGLRHHVERGETLYRIGKAYGVSDQEIARVNGIHDPNRIEVGQELVIPHATRPVPVNVVTPEQARDDRPTMPELPTGSQPFVWPVAGGSILSDFGPRGETHHDGIDIACALGSPVRAARTGNVLYSDRLRGYGNLIILEHGEGYVTVYAHNRENLVRTGVQVRQGDVIATVGESGKTSGANLHFEVRKDNVARNPLYFLPPLTTARASVVEKAP
jgi:murein DD-endopeptidase MepM/ murein hydrolase activator NlpD